MTLRSVISLIILTTLAAYSAAKPARRDTIPMTQTDGSVINTMLIGDEFSHIRTLTDGSPIAYDRNLGYVYADILDNGEVVPTGQKAGATTRANGQQYDRSRIRLALDYRRNHNGRSYSGDRQTRGIGLYSTSYFPTTGSPKALVILVEFTDCRFGDQIKAGSKYNSIRPGYTAHDYFNELLNGDNFSAYNATGSCRQWFVDNSRNADGIPQFEPEFDLFGPVLLPHNVEYYGGNDQYGNDQRSCQMVVDACKMLDSEIDFSQYDNDGDGHVDNVYLIYAGLGEADGGSEDTIWPHAWFISGQGLTLRLDGVRISRYGCGNEIDGNLEIPDGIGTFVHEFSHILGLPDLYNTNDQDASYSPGSFSALDYGPYNNNGRTPPNYSAFERSALDWMEPIEITAPQDFYNIPPMTESNVSFRVNVLDSHGNIVPDEFFLIETRPQVGNDKFLPGHGMLIWHIDYDKWVFDANNVNNDPDHLRVDLVEANSPVNKKRPNPAGHPFPGSTNVTSHEFKPWNSVQKTGVTMTGISEDPVTGKISGTITNTCSPELNSVINVEIDYSTPASYYNLQGLPVAGPQPGDIYIVRKGTNTYIIRL